MSITALACKPLQLSTLACQPSQGLFAGTTRLTLYQREADSLYEGRLQLCQAASLTIPGTQILECCLVIVRYSMSWNITMGCSRYRKPWRAADSGQQTKPW